MPDLAQNAVPLTRDSEEPAVLVHGWCPCQNRPRRPEFLLCLKVGLCNIPEGTERPSGWRAPAHSTARIHPFPCRNCGTLHSHLQALQKMPLWIILTVPAGSVECAADALQGARLPGGGAAQQPEGQHGAAQQATAGKGGLTLRTHRFDRASFGIGVLTTNRYQPPEHVGDPMPSAAIQQQSEAAAAQAMADRMAGAAASGVRACAPLCVCFTRLRAWQTKRKVSPYVERVIKCHRGRDFGVVVQLMRSVSEYLEAVLQRQMPHSYAAHSLQNSTCNVSLVPPDVTVGAGPMGVFKKRKEKVTEAKKAACIKERRVQSRILIHATQL
eukprot:scaffold11116_cov18-Tisochrysis_lutea.AAC.2